jgi:hypothetical protein
VPMLVVAAVGLLIGAGIGPVAPKVGRGIERAVLAVARAIAALARAIGRLFARGRPARVVYHSSASPLRTKPSPPPVVTSNWTAHVPGIVGIIVLALVFGILAIVIARGAHRFSVRRNPSTPAGDEERDSVFSWRHLWDQLRTLFMRLFSRSYRQPAQEASGTLSVLAASRSGVRHEYGRFLRETGRAGLGRYPQETTREFARRLQSVPSLAAGRTDDLQLLTNLYDRVRYGNYVGTQRDVATARSLVDRVIGNLITDAERVDITAASDVAPRRTSDPYPQAP